MTAVPRWGPEQRAREQSLLTELRDLSPDDPRRAQVRDALVTLHLPLVRHVARRYRGRGEPLEDLEQVGTVGLIKAVDRFDPDRGAELATFATPTILGEIRRHFRDRTWAVHVPRRLQELSARLAVTADALTHDLGRSPTVRELAEALGVEQEEVLEALEAHHGYATESLETPGEDGPANEVGHLDPAFELIEDRESLRPLILALPDRERRILMLRFFRGMSQSQIAEEMGISQMHVSRLLAHAIGTLRAGMAAGGTDAEPAA